MKRVLLTGASGFIGRQCLPFLLARGYEVHAASIDAQAGADNAGIIWHRVDLLDSLQVETLVAQTQPSHLLHFAWNVEPGKYWTSPDNLRWVQASLTLLQAFVQNGGQRVVMAGSCAEYDWQYGYCSESVTPLIPATLYGTCKHALQTILSAYANQTGLSAAWGRIFFLYGPGEHPNRLVASVIRSLLQDQPARCSHGNQVRDFLHVADVAGAFAALLDNTVTGAINIASGQPVTLKDLIYRIADQLNRRDLIQLGAIPTAATEPPLLVADVRQLNTKVDWQPIYDLDKGLAHTIEWWRNRDKQKA
jgi:nucleoside-diphosphate-sugar epimerase